MRYDLIKGNKVISHFDYQQVSTKQLIELHRLGYTFGISDKQYMIMLSNQAIRPEGAAQQ